MQIGPYPLPGPYLLAPMAGLVSTPFRGIARAHGAAATPTELISAKGLLMHNRRTADMVRPAPGERPFWVQLFGADPDQMARAALVAARLGAEIIDLNVGCPVRKVVADGAGAALMLDPARAAAIVAAMRRALGDGVPITAKIRSGWDSSRINAVEVGRALEQAGAAALCLHPRTRSQRYAGRADWPLVAALKRAVRIPVIGNGDVGCVADARRLTAESGCDAVMVGRAALGNPWIFTGLLRGRDCDPTPAERCQVVLEHYRLLVEQCGDEQRAIYRFRSRVLHYTRGLDGGVAFRRHIVTVDDPMRFVAELRAYFGQAERARGFRPGRDGALQLHGE